MAVKAIPDGYHTVTPYLIVHDAAAAIEFYTRAFGASETMRMNGPDGCVMHAELRIGDSAVMLADEVPAMGIRSAKTVGASPVSLLIYDADADARVEAAVAAGATVVRPVADQFYGDRSGTITDPFGHTWTIATHKEDLTMEQIQERFEKMMESA